MRASIRTTAAEAKTALALQLHDFLVGYAKGSLLSDLDGTEISAFSLPFSKEG